MGSLKEDILLHSIQLFIRIETFFHLPGRATSPLLLLTFYIRVWPSFLVVLHKTSTPQNLHLHPRDAETESTDYTD
jgi:hypothetical protein